MEGKVRVMNFGVRGQIAEIRHALEDCLQSGYWLLIQNYHLAEEPEQGFFDLLKVGQNGVELWSLMPYSKLVTYYIVVVSSRMVEPNMEKTTDLQGSVLTHF